MRASTLLFVVSILSVAACGGASQGAAGQDCYPNGTCNAGLVCGSGKCAAGSPDGGSPDGGSPDTGAPDTGAPDTGTPDAGTPDMGPMSCDPSTELDETATSTCGAGMRCAYRFDDG